MGSYDNNKRRNPQQKTKYANDRPKPLRTTIPVFYYGVTGTENPQAYDPDSLFTILNTLEENKIFSMISIPIHMNRSDVGGEPGKKGTSVVGYFRGMEDEDQAAIIVNVRFVDYFKKIDKPTLFVNGIVRDGKLSTILNAVILPWDYLAETYKDYAPNYDDEDIEEEDSADEE